MSLAYLWLTASGSSPLYSLRWARIQAGAAKKLTMMTEKWASCVMEDNLRLGGPATQVWWWNCFTGCSVAGLAAALRANRARVVVREIIFLPFAEWNFLTIKSYLTHGICGIHAITVQGKQNYFDSGDNVGTTTIYFI